MMLGLREQFYSGALKPVIHRRYSFAQVRVALDVMAQRAVIGKSLLLSEQGLDASTARNVSI
ncbi:MAG: hypothetical protein FJY56_02005 [Betaproteobacteria bacterium]|nr:hypothetical protein [Betaproteobacteria bacterium]